MKYLEIMKRSGFTMVTGAIGIVTLLGLILLITLDIRTIQSINFVKYASREEIIQNLQSSNPVFDLSLSALHITLSPEKFNDLIIINDQIINYLCMKLFTYLIMTLIFLLISMLFLRFISNRVFNRKNGRIIEVIGILVLILGVSSNYEQPMKNALFMNATQLGEYFSSKNHYVGYGFYYGEPNWGMIVGAGVIWLVGRAFRYGAFLQEEYDATV